MGGGSVIKGERLRPGRNPRIFQTDRWTQALRWVPDGILVPI